MSTEYSLTVINTSDLASPTFVLFAKLPTTGDSSSLATAWLTEQINNGGNHKVFKWQIKWGFSWADFGTSENVQWAGGGSLEADPDSKDEGCAAELIWNGDFSLKYTKGIADGNTLTINGSPDLPPYSEQPGSVAVTLDGHPASVTNTGPALTHGFKLHPTYFLTARTHVQGQMVDETTLSKFQEIDFANSNALTAILDKHNRWKVESTNKVNLAEILAP